MTRFKGPVDIFGCGSSFRCVAFVAEHFLDRLNHPSTLPGPQVHGRAVLNDLRCTNRPGNNVPYISSVADLLAGSPYHKWDLANKDASNHRDHGVVFVAALSKFGKTSIQRSGVVNSKLKSTRQVTVKKLARPMRPQRPRGWSAGSTRWTGRRADRLSSASRCLHGQRAARR